MNRWILIGIVVVGTAATSFNAGVSVGQALEALEREKRPVQPEDFAARDSFRMPEGCPSVRDGVELDCIRNGHRVRCDMGLEEDAPGYLPPSTGPDALHLLDRRHP